jgi:hypothetical protein
VAASPVDDAYSKVILRNQYIAPVQASIYSTAAFILFSFIRSGKNSSQL